MLKWCNENSSCVQFARNIFVFIPYDFKLTPTRPPLAYQVTMTDQKNFHLAYVHCVVAVETWFWSGSRSFSWHRSFFSENWQILSSRVSLLSRLGWRVEAIFLINSTNVLIHKRLKSFEATPDNFSSAQHIEIEFINQRKRFSLAKTVDNEQESRFINLFHQPKRLINFHNNFLPEFFW